MPWSVRSAAMGLMSLVNLDSTAQCLNFYKYINLIPNKKIYFNKLSILNLKNSEPFNTIDLFIFNL